MRIDVYHTESGQLYRTSATLKMLFSGEYAGFDFYPVYGSKIRCLIDDNNNVVNRSTGYIVGTYNPDRREAGLNLDLEFGLVAEEFISGLGESGLNLDE